MLPFIGSHLRSAALIDLEARGKAPGKRIIPRLLRLDISCSDVGLALPRFSSRPCLESTALGAKCRVHRWEDRSCGGLGVRRRLRRLVAAEALCPFLDRTAAWRSWFAGNFFANLQQTQQRLTKLAGVERLTVDGLLQGAASVPVPQGRWQRQCSQLLRQPDLLCFERHLRRRLDRWTMPFFLAIGFVVSSLFFGAWARWCPRVCGRPHSRP